MFLSILVTIFVLIILYKLFKQKQNNRISFLSFIFWCILWLIVLLLFWQPEIASYFAFNLGIGRGVDLVIYLSILIIFSLLFKIFERLYKIERDITKLTREDAIKNVRKR